MIHRPEEALDLISDLLRLNAGSLGINYVGYGDEELIPSYPAVVITPGVVDRKLHATHTFQVILLVSMWVYHARLTASRKIRTKEDLLLATGIVELLHTPPNSHLGFDTSNNRNIIYGFVESEDPGTIMTRKNNAVIATRLSWMGTTQRRFQ
jgi:hypothetical protein